MSKPRGEWASAQATGQAQGEQLELVREQTRVAAESTDMELSKIKPREKDSRKLDAKHVVELAESIRAVGLIEPLVLDKKFRLISGGHRLAALRLLAAPTKEKREAVCTEVLGDPLGSKDKEKLAQIPVGEGRGTAPVRVLDFDAEEDPGRAFEMEVVENEVRRDYTLEEVRHFEARLRELGYEDVTGRPRSGVRALGPALATIVGKSQRHMRRIRNETKSRTDGRLSPDEEQQAKRIEQEKALKALRRAATKAVGLLEGEAQGRPKKVLELLEKRLLPLLVEPQEKARTKKTSAR